MEHLFLEAKKHLLLLPGELSLSPRFYKVERMQGLGLIPARDEDLLEDVCLTDLFRLCVPPDRAVLLLKVHAV